MFARLLSLTKQGYKKIPKVLFLSLIIFFSFIFFKTTHAQIDTSLDAYKNIFSRNTQISSPEMLRIIDWVKNADNSKVIGIKFNFSAEFDTSRNIPVQQNSGNAVQDKLAWYWDHVVEFDNEEQYAFLIRFCPTTSSGGCAFIQVPYNQVAVEGDLNYTEVTDRSTRVYRHRPLLAILGASYSEGEYLGNFSVNFEKTEFFKANPQGKLTTEKTTLTSGTQYRADMWYCSDGPTTGLSTDVTPPIGNAIPTNDERVKNFGAICEGKEKAYFRIGNPITFTFPSNTTTLPPDTVNQSETQVGNTTKNTPSETLPYCDMSFGVLSGFGAKGTFLGCIAQVAFYLIYKPIEWFAMIMGYIFDFFLGYSLDDTSYRAEFAVTGWKTVRDISNIFFIIILVFTGIMASLKADTGQIKKVIPSIIISAVLINFSLFGVRLFIDLSNVVARVFYNSIHVCEGTCEDNNGDGTIDNPKESKIGGYKHVSEKIVSIYNPQNIFNYTSITPEFATTNEVAQQGIDRESARSSYDYAGYYILVSLLAAGIMFGIALMFWKTGFFFLGRVVGLYLAMIFAPLAVVAQKPIPFLGKIPMISWSEWLDELTKYCLLAPIFMFFLYLIYIIAQSPFIKVISTGTADSFLGTVLKAAVPMLFVYFMTKQGVDLAKSYAGRAGKLAQEYGNMAAGIGMGVAAGGAGILGRRTLGLAASTLNKSKYADKLRDLAAKKGTNGWLARQQIKALNYGEKASFDARKAPGASKLFKEMGVNPDQKAINALSFMGLGFGTNKTEGGYQAAIKREQDQRVKEADLYKTNRSDDQVAAEYRQENQKRREEYDKKVDNIINQKIASQQNMTLQAVEQLKTNNLAQYNAHRATAVAVVQDEIDKIEQPKEILTAKDLDNERKKAFQDRLKKGGLLTKQFKNFTELAEKNFDTGGVTGNIKGIGAAIVATAMGTAEILTGEREKYEGDKKAAKKLGDNTKVETELVQINKTLTGGFQNLIALEKFQNTATFTNLTDPEKRDILSGKRNLYDYLSKTERDEVDNDMKSKDFREKRQKQYSDIIKQQQRDRIEAEYSSVKQDEQQEYGNMMNNPGDVTIRQKWLKLKARKKQLEKQKNDWKNIDKVMENLNNKLKAEGDGKK